MPNLTYTVADFVPFTKIYSADVVSRFNDIKTLLNTTGLDDTNLQNAGITRSTKLKAGTADYVLINDATGKMSEEATLARTRGGLGFAPSLTSNALLGIRVNSAETGFELGSPLTDTITETLASYIATLTSAAGISVNDAVCLDLHNGSGSNVYRIYKADTTTGGRKSSFIGIATTAGTVTPQITTYTISAAYVASNLVPITINGRAYSTTYASSSDATLQALATLIGTDPDVLSATVTVVGGGQTGTDDRVITITSRGGLSLNITSTTVTGGASQPTITLNNTQAASGTNVKIQTFGPVSGFVALSIGDFYYVGSNGAITNAPSDTNPVLVGQAISSTVLFVNGFRNGFSFTGPEAFVVSHGSSDLSAANAQQDVEHFNFSAWSTGTASAFGARYKGLVSGVSSYNSQHLQLDGVNTSGNVAALFQSYNKNSWTSLTTRATAKCRFGGHAFNGYYYAGKGATTDADGTAGNPNERWNGNAWATGSTLGTSGGCPGAFVQGSKIHYVAGTSTGGVGQSAHDTIDTSGSVSTATTTTGTGYNGASSTCGVASAKGYHNVATGNSAYTWDGASWSSAITMNYAPSGTSTLGAACGYSSGRGLAYTNGGSSGAAAIATSQSFDGSAFSSTTSSSNSRSARIGSIF